MKEKNEESREVETEHKFFEDSRRKYHVGETKKSLQENTNRVVWDWENTIDTNNNLLDINVNKIITTHQHQRR